VLNVRGRPSVSAGAVLSAGVRGVSGHAFALYPPLAQTGAPCMRALFSNRVSVTHRHAGGCANLAAGWQADMAGRLALGGLRCSAGAARRTGEHTADERSVRCPLGPVRRLGASAGRERVCGGWGRAHARARVCAGFAWGVDAGCGECRLHAGSCAGWGSSGVCRVQAEVWVQAGACVCR
jgi:hypothetical protein